MWKITHRCNLSCTYCDGSGRLAASQPEEIDRYKIAADIARVRPKIVDVTGGEPTLVSNLSGILKTIKETYNPFIQVATNLTLPEALKPALPFVDRVLVSLDGPGDVNRRTRGVSGDRILDNVVKILPALRETKTGLLVNCVVSKSNVGQIEALVNQVLSLDPTVVISLSALVPPWHAESIMGNPPVLDKCLTVCKRFAMTGRVFETFSAFLGYSGDLRKYTCFSQFFQYRITPEGQIYSCAMNMPLGLSSMLKRSRKRITLPGLQRFALSLARSAAGRLTGRLHTTCTLPCFCEMWIDMLLQNRWFDSHLIDARGLLSRLDSRDLAEVTEFAKRHVRADFRDDVFLSQLRAVEAGERWTTLAGEPRARLAG
jgi:sulfatase maturation enzyme AslB (radical SAM superfamily)